jgi:uncharacterized protein YabN with tetrapyrrole methylase and pyrophosphatase domain
MQDESRQDSETTDRRRSLDDALALMRDLRARCEWDAAQTHQSLRPYLVEEAAEVDDAIAGGDDATLRDELGDVLLQVLFHAVIAEERGAFDVQDVAGALVSKMRARHPHLYGDGVKRDWETMKAGSRRFIDEGLASGLPALHRAHRLQDRAAGVGFDWPDAVGPLAKVREEVEEVAECLAPAGTAPAGTAPTGTAPTGSAPDAARLEGELGDLLFSVVNLCRKLGVHAGLALDGANQKFARRFRSMEALAESRGVVFRDLSLAEQDALWTEVKLGE